MGVERYRLDRVLDLDIDVALALISPWFARFEVEEGERVVDGFDTLSYVSQCSYNFCVVLTYSSGRISRSEAILIKALEASLEHCLLFGLWIV